MSRTLLQLRRLTVTFEGKAAPVRAVRDVNLEVHTGQSIGLVGESGSGKSALGAALMNLHDRATTHVTAEHWQLGHTLLDPNNEVTWRHVRGRRIAMVFQDPMTALNPYRRIGSQLHEVLRTHTNLSKADRARRCIAALHDVGLADGAALLRAYPHMLSGGMRQRVVIAIALLAGPELLIADEPTTALDVTVQAQILALIKGLCESRGMALIIISHDLAVLAGIADRIAVMYAGTLVEVGPTQALHDNPGHPYSRALWRAMPDVTASDRQPEPIDGTPPDLSMPPSGCAFAPRCPRMQPVCQTADPEEHKDPEHGTQLRCHNPEPPAHKVTV